MEAAIEESLSKTTGSLASSLLAIPGKVVVVVAGVLVKVFVALGVSRAQDSKEDTSGELHSFTMNS